MRVSKICTACGEDKPLSCFHVQKKGRNGRQAKCKPCSSAAYYVPNRNKVLAAVRERRATEKGREQEREWQRARRLANPIIRMLQEARVRASKRGMEFNILPSDVEIPERCPALGIVIEVGSGRRADCSPSLDRVDTSRGYVRGNVRIISWRANRLKSDASLQELKDLVAYTEAALGVAATVAGITPESQRVAM